MIHAIEINESTHGQISVIKQIYCGGAEIAIDPGTSSRGHVSGQCLKDALHEKGVINRSGDSCQSSKSNDRDELNGLPKHTLKNV